MGRFLTAGLVPLLFLGTASHSLTLDELLNTPRMDPCALFTDDADYATLFFIDMDLEGGEVQMQVPKIFLDDRWDHQDGVRHGSQLFRMMIDNFLPITRRQTGEFNKARTWEPGHQAYMHFLVGDYVDLNKQAEFSLERLVAPSHERPITDYQTEPFDNGLTRFIPFEGELQKDLFASDSEEGEINAVIQCSAVGTVRYPACQQFFRSNGMDVRLTFPRPYLPKWEQMQSDVDRFLTSATRSNQI